MNTATTTQKILNVEQFSTLDLPIVQKAFIEHISNDNTLDGLLSFEKLGFILNPTFTYHYFYVSGTTPENMVTTKSTDSSCAANGSQSLDAENNATALAECVKDYLISLGLKSGWEIYENDEQLKEIAQMKLSLAKRRYYLHHNGKWVRIHGISTANFINK